MTDAQAFLMDNNYKPVDGMNSYEDKKLYKKDNYKSTEYTSYEKDNIYKSKDSGNVIVKKIKCNNINVNVNGFNGLKLNALPTSLNVLATDEALASKEGEIGASSFESSERNNNGNQHNDKDFRFVCINNNNFEVVEDGTTPTEPLTCEECFEEFLSQDELDLFGELFGSTIDRFCILFTNPDFELVVPEDAFRLALPGVDSEDIDKLIDCLEEKGVIFIQDTPPI
jgi:hypothetical protein